MEKQKENHRVIVLCKHCQAPTKLPKEIEFKIAHFTEYQCWECKKQVPITKDLRAFIWATRE